ncbi:MAG: hypothetical protein OSJ60_19700 [Lachnospiraceae bacterium]|nr:hypothetical protein [Lachnospiraceae bacterium]
MKKKYIDGCFRIMNRRIQKSVRLDDRIYRYIMQHDGKNFSDKLENLVLDHVRLTGHLDDVT